MHATLIQADPAPSPDAALVDAYSQAVSGAVAAAHPAVVHIEVGGADAPGGSGSGFFISPDGYLPTAMSSMAPAACASSSRTDAASRLT